MTRADRAKAATLKSEGVLADLVRRSTKALNPSTLAHSYGLPVERVVSIITRNGGSIG